jgi:hypothetical protein
VQFFSKSCRFFFPLIAGAMPAGMIKSGFAVYKAA